MLKTGDRQLDRVAGFSVGQLQPCAEAAQAFVEEARVVRSVVEHDAVGRRLIHQPPAAIDVQAVRAAGFDELLCRLRAEIGHIGDVRSVEGAQRHALSQLSNTSLTAACAPYMPSKPVYRALATRPCMVHSRVMPHALPSRTASRSASLLPVSMCCRSIT